MTVPTLERLGCLVLEIWFLSCDYIWPRELNSKRIWSSVSGRGLAVLVLISVSEDSNNKVNSPEKGRKYSSRSFDPTFYQKVLLLDWWGHCRNRKTGISRSTIFFKAVQLKGHSRSVQEESVHTRNGGGRGFYRMPSGLLWMQGSTWRSIPLQSGRYCSRKSGGPLRSILEPNSDNNGCYQESLHSHPELESTWSVGSLTLYSRCWGWRGRIRSMYSLIDCFLQEADNEIGAGLWPQDLRG